MQVVKKQTPCNAVQYRNPGDCKDVVYYRSRDREIGIWLECRADYPGAAPVVDVKGRWMFIDPDFWIISSAEGVQDLISDRRFLEAYTIVDQK